MELLPMEQWSAKWIGSPDASCRSPLLRKRFELPRLPRSAHVFICGLGYHELYINGQRVGDHVLDPAQTDYETRCFYVSHDVTAFLRAGANAIGVMLGNGFFTQDQVWGGMSYGRPRAIAQLRVNVEFVVMTDGTWLAHAGPVLENNVYAGETYDARKEFPRWSEADCDESNWSPAEEVDSPTKSLEPQLMPPIRRVQTIEPVAVKDVGGKKIFDFGQNFAGWARLRATGTVAGDRIRLRSAESIHPDGSLDPASTGVFATNVEQIDTFIARGDLREEWEPRFTYHGFRYVEVAAPYPAKVSLTGVVVHSDLERIGTFECSDPMLNRIYQMALWSIVSNLHGLPTDCPAREKCGWLGDAHIAAEVLLYNYDAAAFLRKYLRDIETSWRGELPGDVAPGKRCSNPNGHTDWGYAIVMLPWHVYLFTRDDTVLSDHYASMKKFLTNLAPRIKDNVVTGGYGDWCPPGSVEPVLTPSDLTTTAWYIQACRVMSQVAAKLGEPTDAYRKSEEHSLRAFNAKFFNAAKNNYGSQTADAMALELDLVPPENRNAVAASLRDDVMVKHNAHHTTGIFGSRYLHAALTRHGHGDAALAVLRQTTYPSIGHLISLGATTFWECWGEQELDKKWGARSRNHPMQAGFVAWFHQGLGGIIFTLDGLTLRPQFIKGIDHVRAAHRDITSEWRRAGDRIVWNINLPRNATARVEAPGITRTLRGGTHEFTLRA